MSVTLEYAHFHSALRCAALVALVALAPLPLRGADTEAAPVPVVDLHVDLPYQVNYKSARFAEGTGQYVASELRASGVSGVVLPLYIPREVSPSGPRTIDLETSYQTVLGLLPRTAPYALPGCAASKETVRTWFSFEGAAPLASDASAVDTWVRRGVRLFGLVHTYDNALATSSGTIGAKKGLTRAGRQLVRKIFGAGAVVDVSHASDAATDEVIALAKEARSVVVASHSNARAIAGHPRNLTDDQMRGIAETGGVIGINFHARFLTGGVRATLADVVRHIRHAVRVAGVQHVAIGSDFEGGIRPASALEGVRGFPRLSRALREAGLSGEDVERIFHRNALRVLCGADAAPEPKSPSE